MITTITKNMITFIVMFCCIFSINANQWTVLIYLDSIDNTNSLSIDMINSIITAKPNSNVNLLIQTYSNDKQIYRYKVEDNSIKLIDKILNKNDTKNNLIDAMSWAFNSYTSKHTMLILENNIEKKLNFYYRGIKEYNNEYLCNRYLYNEDLIQALDETIKALGKKIDVIGFDAPISGLFEISYQLSPFARFHIGSQGHKLYNGWDFKSLIRKLNQYGQSPRNIARSIVDLSNKHYEHQIDFIDSLKDHKYSQDRAYTLSAVDLSYTLRLKEALDHLASLILSCDDCDMDYLKKNFTRACNNSIIISFEFTYIDIYEFCNRLKLYFKDISSKDKYQAILLKLDHIKNLIGCAIVNCCSGKELKHKAYGMSIYIPRGNIDKLYNSTIFAQESTKWMKLLEYSLNGVA